MYQAYCSVIKQRGSEDKTIWDADFQCFHTLEEAEEAAVSSYYKYLEEYMSNGRYASRVLLLENVKDKVHRHCISVTYCFRSLVWKQPKVFATRWIKG